SGPSIKDEVANALFWVGVMQGMPEEYKNIWEKIPFNDARGNFINAARTGINTYFNWFGEGISAKRLVKKILIPMAKKGLKKSNINSKDIKYYLNIIEKRVDKNITGSKWMVRSSRKLRQSVSKDVSCLLLTYHMFKNQQTGKPIYQWDEADASSNSLSKKFDKLYKVMTTELFVVNEDDLVELVAKIMQWKNINHLPVVNKFNKIIGIITKSNLAGIDFLEAKEQMIVAKDIMVRKVVTVDPETLVEDAREIMKLNNIGCLPIIESGELIGIFTKNDLKKIDKYSNGND
ncbi:MAG: CBS domain-containing protein, partial [Bacteroidia bacterium]|nr:CBS domain-containing protein [Bacteroidia bacterium]